MRSQYYEILALIIIVLFIILITFSTSSVFWIYTHTHTKQVTRVNLSVALTQSAFLYNEQVASHRDGFLFSGILNRILSQSSPNKPNNKKKNPKKQTKYGKNPKKKKQI